jgi:hypothetical protein
MARWKLTDKQWDALDELRFSTTEVAVFRNATVILMSGVGRSVQSIAKELGCSPATVDNVRLRSIAYYCCQLPRSRKSTFIGIRGMARPPPAESIPIASCECFVRWN